MTETVAAPVTPTLPQLPPKDSDAILHGWGEPTFPESMTPLQQLLDAIEVDGELLDICLEGYLSNYVPRSEEPLLTMDGHEWKARRRFTMPSGVDVTLLISKKYPNGGSIRFCALYVQAEKRPTDAELKRFFYLFCKHLK